MTFFEAVTTGGVRPLAPPAVTKKLLHYNANQFTRFSLYGGDIAQDQVTTELV